MKVISYAGVVSGSSKNPEKIQLLEKFIQGVNAKGDTGVFYQSNTLQSCDVAVIQGWQHEKGKRAPHLRLREEVINNQLQNNKRVCVADANLFLYATSQNEPHHYLRYSFDGVFRNTGIYFDDNPDPKRWQQISKDLNIELQPLKNNGSNILICLQRDGGWSMQGQDIFDWTRKIVKNIRRFSDRNIIIRSHPGDKRAIHTYMPKIARHYYGDKTIKISINKSLNYDLNNAYAVVNHNSSSIVGPIIMGHHAFITDPVTSQCTDVSHVGFNDLENPKEFDRLKWLERISMCHWKFEELENGKMWEHIRKYC